MNDATPGDAAPGVRGFLALLPGITGRQTLQRCRDTLAHAAGGAAHGVRWIDPTALHLTLRFLGDSSRAQIEYLQHMLPTLAPSLPALATRRHAIWPNRARPRMLVLELADDPRLADLARACEDEVRKAGYAVDTRSFRAHVTLARLRPGAAFGILPNPPPKIQFEAVALMRSTFGQPATHYTELARVALPARA